MGKTLAEEMQEFQRAWRQLWTLVAEHWQIPRLVRWLNGKLERKP